ncbi:LVIVD repeat-containing protein [Solicola sp. PLA-1-18]|uniref:LVIVD repeat-containing protein n=1 Tax=Solicola sp. PLA-1-18 TaxID=3380532 RepID=UPI003B7AD58C
MKNRTWRAPRPRRHATVIGTAVAGLVLAVGMNGQAFADDEEEREGASTRSAGSSCSAAELAELKAAGDNFAQACLPGNDFAGLKAQPDTLKPGESDSSDNLSLIANLPKQGPFASEAALNSDLAFKGDYVFAGNYEGFMVYDVKRPKYPRIVAQVKCTGAQNDISVYKNLLVLSVDSSRNDSSCASTAQSATVKTSWEGVRVFDISNPASPRYVSAVETPCGSHTHTLAPDKKNKNVYVYVSSYSPNAAFPDCQPPHDKIGVVKVPVDDPAAAKLVGTPVLFPDGGQPAGGYSSQTTGCHDITAYPSKDIAAGACMGDGILMDISDRENPKVTTTVRDTENFAFWHSATFNNAGTKVVFTDELGGGGGPTCNPETGRTKGADAIYDITRLGQLKFGSYYKIPRTQSNTENCVAHNGSLIPVEGKDIMVQAWYQGGISVMDFTNSKKPKEIAWFDRGPISDTELKTGGSWSAYYYNGYIYSNDIQKGLDVLSLDDKRTDGAKKVRMDRFNPQSQPFYNN